MSRSRNTAEILGHLGQDPELRYTSDGTAVCNFSVATNQYDRDEPEWHNCTAWGSLAEVVGEHLAKGERVFVEGSLQTNTWEDPDGNRRSTTEIHADEVIFLGSDETAAGGSSGGQPKDEPQKQPAGGGETSDFEPDDQLPF